MHTFFKTFENKDLSHSRINCLNLWLKSVIFQYFCIRLRILMIFVEKRYGFTKIQSAIGEQTIFEQSKIEDFLCFCTYFSNSWPKFIKPGFFCIRRRIMMILAENLQDFTGTQNVIEVHCFSQTSKINDLSHFSTNCCNFCAKPVNY